MDGVQQPISNSRVTRSSRSRSVTTETKTNKLQSLTTFHQEVQQKAQQENTTLVSVLADIDIAINEVKENMKNLKKDMNNLKTEIRDIIRAEVATLVKTEVDKKLKKLEVVCKE